MLSLIRTTLLILSFKRHNTATRESKFFKNRKLLPNLETTGQLARTLTQLDAKNVPFMLFMVFWTNSHPKKPCIHPHFHFRSGHPLHQACAHLQSN